MASKRSNIYGGVPPVSDHSWLKNTRSLLKFLACPRSWKDLEKAPGSRSGSLLRHSLAWLECQGEARTVFISGTLYWVRVGGLWATNPPYDSEGQHDSEGHSHLNPVIPKPPHMPSIPSFEALDKPAGDTLPPDTEPDPLPHLGDTIPVSNPIGEAEGQVDHYSAISTIPTPYD